MALRKCCKRLTSIKAIYDEAGKGTIVLPAVDTRNL